MSATDFFSFLPDWQTGIKIKYRFDTVIDSCETGNEQARIPLYSKMRRTLNCTHFSPMYMIQIENFLRKFHADFFQVPIFNEPIFPVGVYGTLLKNVTTIQIATGLLSKFNLNNLCSKILMVDTTNETNAELHTLVSVDTDSQMTIGGTFTKDFIMGNTVYFPVMQAYTNGFSDTMATEKLQDTALTFEEYY